MKDSSGNILFIILIAVALFAALSYAITQSTRSGGGNSSREATLVDSSAIQQYTSSVRGAVTRMIVNGVDITDIEFNPPSDFGNLTAPASGVFNNAGGAIVYQTGPLSVINTSSDNPSGLWIFSLNYEVQGVGTSAAGSLNGNDLIAFLVGIKKEVCEQLNNKLGITSMPLAISGTYAGSLIWYQDTYYVDNDYVLPATEEVIGGGTMSALDGQYEGCFFQSDDKDYVYYSVIAAR